MGTLNAIYVRATDPQTVKALQKKYRKATTEAGSEFCWIPRSEDDFRVPKKDLAALAATLDTDVLWLSYQSVSDSFAYHHWQRGELVRSLEYQTTEEGWNSVEGEDESWEKAAFFDENPRETTADAEEKRELKRLCPDGKVLAGEVKPFIDAREAARAVAEHYRLPGWGLKEAKDPKPKKPAFGKAVTKKRK